MPTPETSLHSHGTPDEDEACNVAFGSFLVDEGTQYVGLSVKDIRKFWCAAWEASKAYQDTFVEFYQY